MLSSDYPNLLSRPIVRIARGDRLLPGSYHPNMARKANRARFEMRPDWYLVEWMRSKNMTQAALGKATGWSKATVNDIYHGKTKYYRDILNECARALQINPYELLMPPELANAIKAQTESSFTIVERFREIEPSGVVKTGTSD